MRKAFVYPAGKWRWHVVYRGDEGMGTEVFMLGWRGLVRRRIRRTLRAGSHERAAPEMVVTA